MRRKKRFNVHSNGNIKRCRNMDDFCLYYEGWCRFHTNVIYECIMHPKIQYLKNPVNVHIKHLQPGEKYDLYMHDIEFKVHHYGNGSLLPGKKFVFFAKKHHHSPKFLEEVEYQNNRKKLKKDDLKERLEEYYWLRNQ